MRAVLHLLPRLLPGLALSACLASFAGAARADYFEWESWQDNASHKNGKAQQLVLHVQETDNIRFWGTCPAKPGGLATALLGYNTGTRAEGAPVTLNITSPGYRAALNGRVHGTRQPEGLAGIQLQLNISDPFWTNLEELSFLTYQTAGGPTARLDLTGSGPAVRKFIEACKTLVASAGPAAPTPATQPTATGTPRQPGSLACKGNEQLKSRESKVPVTLTFFNRSEGYRGLVWINFQGQPVDFANIDQGKSYRVKTYLSHVWMMTDGPGNCIEMFTPKAGMTRFDITVPSPAFGPGND